MKFEWEMQNEPFRPPPCLAYVLDYHVRCETYDRKLCPPDGKPVNSRDAAMMNKNAKEVLGDLAAAMCRDGIERNLEESQRMLKNAIRDLPFKSIKREVEKKLSENDV